MEDNFDDCDEYLLDTISEHEAEVEEDDREDANDNRTIDEDEDIEDDLTSYTKIVDDQGVLIPFRSDYSCNEVTEMIRNSDIITENENLFGLMCIRLSVE